MYFFDLQVEWWGDLKPVESNAGESDSKTASTGVKWLNQKKINFLFSSIFAHPKFKKTGKSQRVVARKNLTPRG